MHTHKNPPSRHRWPRLRAAIAAVLAPLGWRPASPAPAGHTGSTASPARWARLSREATQYFEARGLMPEHPGAPWPTGAARLLRKGPRRYLVHAAQWHAPRVDAATVQALMRAVSERGASAGILLCATDVFTPAARALARENAILLLDPSQLRPRPRASEGAAHPASGMSRASPSAFAAPMAAPPTPAAPRRPVLRPDHEVRGRRDFMPTVPLTPGELATPR